MAGDDAAGLESAFEHEADAVVFDLSDPDGLREEALASRRLGFSGKSTLDPSQVRTINEVFART